MSDSAGDTLDEILEHGDEADDCPPRRSSSSPRSPASPGPGSPSSRGARSPSVRMQAPPTSLSADWTAILYDGSLVGELWVDGRADEGFLTRIAASVSPYVLIGWDTQGQTWEP